MHRFNLNNLSKEKMTIIEDYLEKENISILFLEHFAEMSLKDDCNNFNFEENLNFLILLESIQLSILHYDIFKQNEEKLLKILLIEDEKTLLEILNISIEEEKIMRLKRKLENNFNKLDKRLNKDIDLIDKKQKI